VALLNFDSRTVSRKNFISREFYCGAGLAHAVRCLIRHHERIWVDIFWDERPKTRCVHCIISEKPSYERCRHCSCYWTQTRLHCKFNILFMKLWTEQNRSLVLLVYAVFLTLQVSECKDYATILIANLDPVRTWTLRFPCIWYWYIQGRACFGHSNAAPSHQGSVCLSQTFREHTPPQKGL